jgi:HK97 family phage prohead protease
MTLHHSLPLLEVRSQGEGLIAGYAACFDGIDSYGDSIVRGAFSGSLAKHQQAGSMPVMLWSHKTDAPIGRWVTLAEDSRGLQASGQLNLKTTAGREAFEHLRAGDLNGLSIGYRVPEGGKEYRSGVNFLKQIDLHEVSVVAVPADSAARISAVKSQAIKPATVRGLEEALEDLGFSRREARNIAAKGFGGLAEQNDSDELISAIKAATHFFQKA